jgi:hypothetical protein
MSTIKKVNRFSEEYFLYPEIMKQREKQYNEHQKLEEEKRLREMKSK